ncbi:MAG: biphenyl 2,3-dioxygenase [Anaerolineae bacterium UTCFX2]|jgi:3-phenylpropionate/trans-cinnamate dioxygenase ferredoxin subunit|nr:non-heme iron oxygenase ferredoxin subunit [Anaerolineales bacterium]OQY89448.1 MAG: biphenyl 2,3-dioxygenase [Anaerolineae bacterium UTCFX2]
MFNYLKLDPQQCEFIPVASVEDLTAGERLFLDIDGNPIVVFNLAGKYYAIADLCSHDNGPVGEGELDGFEIICPRHGARFDIRDGRVLSLPAVEDIPAYPVQVTEGQIEIGLPFEE